MGCNKLNLKKRIQFMGLAGICMIGVTGCMMSKREMDRQAVEKFEEKYGVDCEFVYVDIIDDSIENRDEVHVYVDDYMKEGETAIVYSWQEKGKVLFEDNLFGFIIREDYENAVKEIAEEEFDEVKVYVDYVGASFDNELTQNSTLEDAYELGEKVTTWMDIIVVSEGAENNFNEICELLCDKLNRERLNGRINFYGVSEGAFQKMTRKNYDDVIGSDWDKPDGKTRLNFYKGKSY